MPPRDHGSHNHSSGNSVGSHVRIVDLNDEVAPLAPLCRYVTISILNPVIYIERSSGTLKSKFDGLIQQASEEAATDVDTLEGAFR